MTLRLARAGKGVLAPGVMFHQRQHEGTRGTREDRFDAASSAAKWVEYDKAFFGDLLADLADAELVPPFARNSDETTQLRTALLQRACIRAKRALWDEAAADIVEACRLGDQSRPLAGERALAGRMLADQLPCKALLEDHDAAREKLRQCHRSGLYGRRIIQAMQGPARWQTRYGLKTGDLGYVGRTLRLCAALVGPVGLLRVFLIKPDGPA